MIACNISKNKTSDHFVDINKMVDIGSGADILDNLGSEELGANIFRITQTEALLAKQKEKDEEDNFKEILNDFQFAFIFFFLCSSLKIEYTLETIWVVVEWSVKFDT